MCRRTRSEKVCSLCTVIKERTLTASFSEKRPTLSIQGRCSMDTPSSTLLLSLHRSRSFAIFHFLELNPYRFELIQLFVAEHFETASKVGDRQSGDRLHSLQIELGGAANGSWPTVQFMEHSVGNHRPLLPVADGAVQ